ncbi:MAG: glycosyltransferase family 2 protein [Egibacteraceae bacterium]
MRVLACVVSWNSAEQLAGALESLLAQTDVDLQIVVVDNASADASREVAAGYPGVAVVANTQNRGFAGGANQGVALAREAGAGAFLVCNPDVSLEPDYLARALAALEADPARAGVQGKLLRTGAAAGTVDTTGHLAFRTRLFRNRGEGEADAGQHEQAGEVFGVSGAVALYRVAALDDVAVDGEVFDEDLFAYWEDVDLDWRLQLRGWQAWYEPTACGWHERGGAGPRRSAFVEELNFANRFLVVAKNDHLPSLVRALPGFVLTSVLKAGELAVTVPRAFVRAVPRLRLLRRMLAKRRLVRSRATVAPAVVVARWFEPFDYLAWVRTWWGRVRGAR